ncbi:Glucose-Methanol-Choline (GMC) oxidoreductase [uncultured virus]|nr:Glucose-Methanol-Choline (GMC) oxidoreductase [uncultured virus]
MKSINLFKTFFSFFALFSITNVAHVNSFEVINDDLTYDFVVVGGGTAGLIVAARLSENPLVSVLVLERGTDETNNPDVALPDVNGFNPLPVYNLPVEDISSREQFFAPSYRGVVPRALGGGPSVSGQAWTKGNASNYDEWASFGNFGWSADDLAPYFKRTERVWNPDPNTGYVFDNSRGVDGPIRNIRLDGYNYGVQYDTLRNSLVTEFGSRNNPDHNSGILGQEGFAPFQRSLEHNFATPIRSTTWTRYLQPVLNRPNVKLMRFATVTKITFNNAKTKATKVKFVHKNKCKVVKILKELILSAGTLNSPRLLLLSGIGPQADLQALNIQVVRNLPGVGKNLQDHSQVQFGYAGLGFPNQNAPITVGFLKSPFSETIDSEIGYGTLPLPNSPFPFLLFILNGLKNEARGEIKLKNNNPLNDDYIMTLNFRSYPQDANKIIWMIRHIRTVTSNLGYPEILPGTAALPSDATDEQIMQWLFSGSNYDTYYHYAGTCKMGPSTDSMRVVDSNLLVDGISNLRVVDASVMPNVCTAHPSFTVAAIAKKASDMIKSHWGL